jgi:hypothetical protein
MTAAAAPASQWVQEERRGIMVQSVERAARRPGSLMAPSSTRAARTRLSDVKGSQRDNLFNLPVRPWLRWPTPWAQPLTAAPGRARIQRIRGGICNGDQDSGIGCSKCHSTIGIIERAAQAAGVVVQIVKVQNPDEIRQSGVSATPAVMIHGKVVHSGGLPSREEVQTWLKPGPTGFLNHPTRHLFFTGKGGVGKTSLSTAAALTLADAGKTVLLSKALPNTAPLSLDVS